MRKIFLLSALVLSTGVAWASDSSIQEHTYDYDLENVNVGTNPNNGSIVTLFDNVNLNGVNVSVSGWSDSARLNSGDSGNYDRVVSAKVQEVYDYGWAVKNTYESAGAHQTIDNTGYQDYDFVLFSFSEAVTLDKLSFGWAATSKGSQEVSVAALGDSNFNALTSENSTWSSIISGAISSSFSITKDASNTLSSTLDFTESAKYWLVGAYNTVFGTVANGSQLNDKFKISGVEFSKTSTTPTPPTEVSEPGALALMALSLGMLLYRRKRAV